MQQRQIAFRAAVKISLAVVFEGSAALGESSVQSGDFVSFQARRTDTVADIPAVSTGFKLHVDSVMNTEKMVDRGNDEFVDRGDSQHFITCHLMVLCQHILHQGSI